MFRSLYRTLLSYTILRKYFTTIFIVLLGFVSIVEVSFFYNDIFELNSIKELSDFIYVFFGLKWALIFGFSAYFFYSFYTFKPEKKSAKEIIQEKPTIKTKKNKTQKINHSTEAKLERLLHKKKLQSRVDKLIHS